MNIKLVIEFDGTAYHGWQVQPNATTIQEELINALFKLTGEKVNLIGCGRTDAGVHAINYTCNFNTNSTIPPERFCYALNTVLPDDIVCKSSGLVDDSFHAKKSIIKKTYIYKITNNSFPSPFNRNYVWNIEQRLNVQNMSKAAKHFIGEHDFIGFASSGFTVKTTIRTIYDCCVNEENGIITISITGNGFLYNMVRILTGTLVNVGLDRIKENDIPMILASLDRRMAGPTAPPSGLYLYNSEYEKQELK